MDPLAQGGRGKRERIGDGLQPLPFDDMAHGLGTAEDAGVVRVFQKVSKVGRASSGKRSFRVRI